MNCLLFTEWFIYHIFLSFHQLCVAAVCLNVILNTLFKDESFSPYHLLQASVCRWEITVMEYQALIYCIIDSEMMPPAVLPPVLSPESRVATHTSTACLPAHGTPEHKHIPINQSKTTRSSSNAQKRETAQHYLWLDKRKGNGLWL